MANRNYTPVSKVTVDLSVLGWSSCLSLMFKGNFFSKCSIWCEALLVRFKTVLQVPALTVFLETVRNLLLPFLRSNENIKEMKHTNFSLLRKGFCQLCTVSIKCPICHHEYIREFDVFENCCLKNEKDQKRELHFNSAKIHPRRGANKTTCMKIYL